MCSPSSPSLVGIVNASAGQTSVEVQVKKKKKTPETTTVQVNAMLYS